MLAITDGHQMPQNANCASSVRFDRMWAPAGGSARNAGTVTSTA